MVVATEKATDTYVTVAGLNVRIMESGRGRPLVMLHHSTGNIGWAPIHSQLAESFRVLAIDMPGFGQSERPAWAREPRDLAILVNRALEKLDLADAVLVGAGMGGFVAAEMAAMSKCHLGGLVLIGAAGLKPRQGEIVDQMMLDFDSYMRRGFADESTFTALFGEESSPEVRQLWDFSREMTARVTWKPYMFSRKLMPLLADIDVPTLVIWGENDRIVPLDCGKQYVEAIPGARLDVVASAGHLVEVESPASVAELIRTFANSRS